MEPTGVAANSGVLSELEGDWAEPARFTVVGPVPLWVMVRPPVTGPLATTGANSTEMLHDAPGATLAQSFDWRNWVVPLATETEPTVSAAVPVLDKVTV